MSKKDIIILIFVLLALGLLFVWDSGVFSKLKKTEGADVTGDEDSDTAGKLSGYSGGGLVVTAGSQNNDTSGGSGSGDDGYGVFAVPSDNKKFDLTATPYRPGGNVVNVGKEPRYSNLPVNSGKKQRTNNQILTKKRR